MTERPVLWVDAANGAAGDMLLAALFDAGADPAAVRAALGGLAVEPIRLATETVRRHGLRATRVEVHTGAAAVPRGPAEIRRLLGAAPLPAPAREFAAAAFDRLAGAEAAVHGVRLEDVHFHEVGALDAIADVVGCAVALHDLGMLAAGAARVVSAVALGSGTVRTGHGVLPVPVPAVAELLRGAPVTAGAGTGESCTPTGAALLATLADRWGPLPPLTLTAHGTGAGTRDPAERPNVLRVFLGTASADGAGGWRADDAVTVEATVDDLDPRLWPGVLDGLVAAGAHDAWLTPVLMRKGRPGHVVTALAARDRVDGVFAALVTGTTTLGARVAPVERRALPRDRVEVEVGGQPISVKRGLLDGRAVTIQPEFDDVARAAAVLGRPVAEIAGLAAARAADPG